MQSLLRLAVSMTLLLGDRNACLCLYHFIRKDTSEAYKLRMYAIILSCLIKASVKRQCMMIFLGVFLKPLSGLLK